MHWDMFMEIYEIQMCSCISVVMEARTSHGNAGSSITTGLDVMVMLNTHLGYTATMLFEDLNNTWMASQLRPMMIGRWWMSFSNAGGWAGDFELHFIQA